jgi:hypothetical protein
MKKMRLTIVALIAICTSAFAQKTVQRIEIQGGATAWENFYKQIYSYPSFEPGVVEYKNGQRFAGSLNYNKVIGAIQFLDEKGDTLAISNEESIQLITIGNDEFFYLAPECFQEVRDGGKFKLVKNERIRIADKQKVGGLGIANSTGTIESIDRLDTRSTYNQIDINEKLLLNKTTKYYLETDKNGLVPASKKNILSMFPKHEEVIREYIKKNQIDFNREDHLAELTGYISQL